ncbi:hypothetical protein GCK72_004098 [Caenorhabditis remanei]|uniref:BTB domain-containing protein n=1 Tax=Caenorhabditis remanei TaxID=31234 RepID=A0A6A5HBA0_CAERE|nr:hypothetical protein GCK72_004098 [Caenorhabditis remanei]KAF1764151.1 hypothetical protein GCK72_004098 [Caenorhabditis remanei]
MSGGPIERRSFTYELTKGNAFVDPSLKYGIECVWRGTMNNSYKSAFTWEFDCNELEYQEEDELKTDKITGHIILKSEKNSFAPVKIEVNLTKDNQMIAKQVGGCYTSDIVNYEYSLTPHYTPIEKPSYDEMFAPSDQNDAILIVDGKKLHVCKTFLSYHSEYFSALFSSNFKEGQMDEIPIGDVSYEDFALLLSTFYPNPSFPTDKTVEKLLELARRFLLSSVIGISENHLLNSSKFNSEKLIWLADEYGMPNLLEKCIRVLNTVEKANKLKKSEAYEQLSDKTKLKIVDRILKLSHI